MNPLHLLWVCPICACFGIFLTAAVAAGHDTEAILEAKRADENPEFLPAAPVRETVDIDYYLEGRRPSGLMEED